METGCICRVYFDSDAPLGPFPHFTISNPADPPAAFGVTPAGEARLERSFAERKRGWVSILAIFYNTTNQIPVLSNLRNEIKINVALKPQITLNKCRLRSVSQIRSELCDQKTLA